MDVNIRWMIRSDMQDVVRIEASSFETPWPEERFYEQLRQRNCIGLVADHRDTPVGFVVYELRSGRLHIINMAVSPDFRCEGVGTAMILKLVGKLSPARRNRITAIVHECNLGAQLFFRANGFLATEILRGLWDDPNEDGYKFQYRLPADVLSAVSE